MNHNYLHSNIMRRVWAIYMFRRASTRSALKFYVLILFVGLESLFVSIKNVWLNTPPVTNPTASANFFFQAFLNTEVFVKVLVVGTIVAFGLIGLDIAKNFHLSSRFQLRRLL